jgi:hypothetical protein
LKYAKQVLGLLNNDGSVRKRDFEMEALEERISYAIGDVDIVYTRWLERMGTWDVDVEEEEEWTIEDDTLGYVAQDVSQPFMSAL